MIILSAVTDILEVKLGGAIATNEARVMTSWRDITTAAFTPGRTVALTNGATAVAAAPAPAASTQRVIDLLNVFNSDTVPITLTVQYDANGTVYVLWSGSLGVGESLQYVDGTGWQRLSVNGLPVSALLVATSVVGGVQSLSGPGAANVTQFSTELTSTGVGDAITLADGSPGQLKSIVHGVDGGSSILTPATKTGYTTITFLAAGDAALLQFFATRGWVVLGSNGVVIA